MKKTTFFDIPDKMFGLDTALMIIFVKPIGLFILLFVVFNLMVYPRIEDIQNGISENDKVNTQEKTLRQKINYLKSIDQDSLKKDELLVTSALMPEKNSYLLVNVVRNIADKFGYTLDSFSVKLGVVDPNGVAVSTEKGYVSVPVQLNLIGPADSYFELTNGLERSLPVLKISKFDMKNTSGVSSIEIEVNGFYISDKKLIDVGKLTLADLTLKQEETDLISQLDHYSVLSDVAGLDGSFNKQKDFVKYTRTDPFNQ